MREGGMGKKRKEYRDEACMMGEQGAGCVASGPIGNLSQAPFLSLSTLLPRGLRLPTIGERFRPGALFPSKLPVERINLHQEEDTGEPT